ncbi:hypothetical protein BDZ91DRAFT_549283 [Kalaharituber pfeilii]|nr:hypothetical protein BDZ91DRAFT_549283 [Kalaharituber pfeilii]
MSSSRNTQEALTNERLLEASQTALPSQFLSADAITEQQQATNSQLPEATNSQQQDDDPETIGRKSAKWQAWEGRALAKQVLADNVFNCARGKSMKGWESVSEHLALIQPVPIIRSALSCKGQCSYLIKAHKSYYHSRKLVQMKMFQLILEIWMR